MPRRVIPPLQPRKKARQDRAEATVEAIIEAAAHILRSRGAESLTTNHMAEVAGVSIGSLYQYFPNKEAVVVALIDWQLRRDAEKLAELAVPGEAPLEEQLRELCEAMCCYHYEVAPLLAELLPLLSPLRQETAVRDHLRLMALRLSAFIAARGDELRPELRDPVRRERTVLLMTDAVRGALNEKALTAPGELLTSTFQADLVRLVVGLLIG